MAELTRSTNLAQQSQGFCAYSALMHLRHQTLIQGDSKQLAQVVGKPNDVASAEATLAQLQERQQQSQGGAGQPARFGAPEQPMTKAINKCLQVFHLVLLTLCTIYSDQHTSSGRISLKKVHLKGTRVSVPGLIGVLLVMTRVWAALTRPSKLILRCGRPLPAVVYATMHREGAVVPLVWQWFRC